MPQYYPLTHAQRGVFAECMRYPESQHYSLPSIIRISKRIDADRLALCVEKVINAFSSYNIRLVWVDGEIRQTLREERDFRVTRIECADSEMERHLQQMLRPFDIFHERLVRVCLFETESELVLFYNFHHLVADGTTLTPLHTSALSALYNDGVEPVETYSMLDYALAQEAYDNSAAHERWEQYYRERFAGRSFRPLPTLEKASPTGHGLLELVDIPREEIDVFVRQMAVRPGFLLEAAYNITLSAFTRSDSVAYLTLQHGRYSRQARQAHGMFIATIPMAFDMDADMPVIDFVRHFKGEMMATVRRADFALMDFLPIVGELPDTLYAYQGPQMLEKIELDGEVFTITQIRIAENTTATFSVVVYENDDAYQLRLECSDAIMDREMLRRFGNSMKACVESIIAHPGAPIRSIQVVAPTEGKHLQDIATEPLTTAPADTVLGLLSENERTAVVASNGSLTYSQLTAGARVVARRLVEAGVRKGDFVVVRTDRSREFVVAIMGIMLAGAAYVPIDDAYPQDRKDYMMQDSGAHLTLTTDTVGQWMNEPSPMDIVLPEVTADMKAYMIYTSGSTGQPKGVVISHGALAAFVGSITQVLGISAEDRIACHSSFSFDASVEDLFPILVAGGTLYIVPESLRRDLLGIAEWLNDNMITGGNYTTRFGQLLLAAADLPHLRYLVVGGEKMTTWPERNRHLRLFNTYGPTECTVDATFYELMESTDCHNIPIGRPLPGVLSFVCDHHGRLLPFGAEGELWLAGGQLADGYWRRDELTTHSFVTLTNPAEGDVVRYYRTGDIVRWNEQKQLMYLRRDDGQVKLNGYRIELCDIDAQLLQHDHILEAKTLVVRQVTDMLCTYFTSDAAIDEDELHNYLQQRLPRYMVPSAFVRLERMPVNVVGKLDISSLPMPQASALAARYAATDDDCPVTHDEEMLLGIVHRVTDNDAIGVNVPLFEAGVTSMQMIQTIMEADKVGIRIKMEHVTESSTIRDIVSSLGSELFCWIDETLTDEVDVVFCGTTSVKQMTDYAKRLHRSVLLSLPIGNDTETSMETMVQEAVGTIRRYLGERHVHAFIGHSFGGEMAYRVAKEWSLVADESPDLVLLDTTLHLPAAEEFVPADGADKYLKFIPEDQRVFWQEYYRKALLVSRLHNEAQLTDYRGHITLYNALQRDRMFLDILPFAKDYVDEDTLTEWKEQMHDMAVANSSDWQSVHPNLTVIDIDADHYGILTQIK